MSLHHDLLDQAGMLAKKEPRRPKQASLRRAVSTAYYALFHLLTSDAADRMVTGEERDALRAGVRRSFQHSTMREASLEVAKANQGRLHPYFGGSPVPRELISVARTFVELQQARHDADYNVSRNWTRNEVTDLLDDAAVAFDNWRAIRKSVSADVFTTALLARIGMRR